MKKIALLVSGQLRYFNYANNSLSRLLTEVKADDIVHTYVSTSIYDYYKFPGDDIIDIKYNKKQLQEMIYKRFPNVVHLELDEEQIDRSSATSSWLQYKRIENLYNWASSSSTDYDIYIRIRPDTFFTRPLDVLDIKEEDVACHIRIANYSGTKGMNDWFYVAGKEAAKSIMRVYTLYHNKTTLRGEDMLYQALIDNKININEFPRVIEILPENYL